MPAIENLIANGSLTTENIAKTLFPDMTSQDWTLEGVNDFTCGIEQKAADIFDKEYGDDEDDVDMYANTTHGIMEATCCTLQEGCEAFKTGRYVAPPKYMTTATYPLEDYDGTSSSARKQLAFDLERGDNYTKVGDRNATYLKTFEQASYGFTFPDGTTLRAGKSIYKANIPAVLDKLESIAGKAHPTQQSALMFALSQAGCGALKGGLISHGIAANEHSSVNFEISKNEETGLITVKYTSPEALPIRFSWTATIDVNGTMSTTPLVVENKQ